MKSIEVNVKLFFGGCIISILSFLTIFLIEYSDEVFSYNSSISISSIFKSTAYCLFVAIIEEFVFRFLFLYKWIKDKERRFTVGVVYLGLVSSILFGFLHLNMDEFPLMQINLALSGVSMFIAAFTFRSIGIAVGMHFSWNFIQGVVFPFEGSGSYLNSIFIATGLAGVYPEASPYMIFSFFVEVFLIWVLAKMIDR